MNKTILLTGGSGYIGSWVTKYLLEKGYTVRFSVRDMSKKDKYQYLVDIEKESDGNLEFCEASLLDEGAYDGPAEGADAIIHMASPFALNSKDPQKQLVDPALKGTRNVLNAANKSTTVKKVVLTSSVAAVHGDNADMNELGIKEFTEEHFNQTSSLKHQPYSYSKVLAEKEAWKIHDAQDKWKLVVINPSFVMGPPLTKSANSESINFMKDILTGKYYMGAPPLMFGFVDVRDIAKAHILGIENEKAEGRNIVCERTMGVFEFTRIIKEKYGNKYKLPLMKSPKVMMYMLGWMFGLTNKFISKNVGHAIKINNSKSKTQLGVSYIPLEQTVVDMVTKMHELDIV